jgi:hypothetical protein
MRCVSLSLSLSVVLVPDETARELQRADVVRVALTDRESDIVREKAVCDRKRDVNTKTTTTNEIRYLETPVMKKNDAAMKCTSTPITAVKRSNASETKRNKNSRH